MLEDNFIKKTAYRLMGAYTYIHPKFSFRFSLILNPLSDLALLGANLMIYWMVFHFFPY